MRNITCILITVLCLGFIQVDAQDSSTKELVYADSVAGHGDFMVIDDFPERDNNKTRLAYAYNEAVALYWNYGRGLDTGVETYIGHGILVKKINEFHALITVITWQTHGMLWWTNEVLTFKCFSVEHTPSADSNTFKVYEWSGRPIIE